ncbi:hypothetical protein QF049_003218 [Paenibacillus sp. W4I10]|uniref:DUF5677 domain-containing protein n=1 Tax=Paenibacillus sp. W4I10 TaxID=3042298 RepID=UPI00278930FC|nr:DUF5677 domain-containing protein [Paenibacillus sp. W4I10]MDQ0721957.1 hypothetical protein [Paenibacillus sp. W4I10]
MNLKKYEKQLLNSLDKFLEKGTMIVKYYGVQDPHGDHINDFVYFCFSKSTKSLKSIILLIRNDLHEDAMSIVRTIYENYLYAKYCLQFPQSINNFVVYSLGKDAGVYFRPSRGKLLDRDGQQIMDYVELTVSEMAKQLGEGSIHTKVYNYLSDFTHPNFVLIDAFLENGMFTINKDSYKYDVLIYSLYCYLKLTEVVMILEDYEEVALTRWLPWLISKTKKQLIEIVNTEIANIEHDILHTSDKDEMKHYEEVITYYSDLIKNIIEPNQ